MGEGWPGRRVSPWSDRAKEEREREGERERKRRVSADFLLTYIPAKLGPAIACVWLHRDCSLTFGLGDAHDDFDFLALGNSPDAVLAPLLAAHLVKSSSRRSLSFSFSFIYSGGTP